MHHWQITKYDPGLRDRSGVYLRDEWTAISDIGRSYSGVLVTVQEYLQTESAYLEAAEGFMRESGILSMQIVGLEAWVPDEPPSYTRFLPELRWDSRIADGDWVGIDDFIKICQLNLRELAWCRLEAPDAGFIHFTYDYYMFIGSVSVCAHSIAAATRSGLYVEPFVSPYRRGC